MNELAHDVATANLRLPKSLDLRSASHLHAEFMAARGRPLTVDASGVDLVGAQCVQILVSAQQTWARDGIALTLSNPSQAFLDSLELLGVPPRKIGEWE